MSQDQVDDSIRTVGIAEKINNAAQPKHPRHRKKEFYNSIRKQMEFYFGDANLLKDRFLMKLIEKDPFVPLEVFLKFNKIKKLTNSVDDIIKALKNSDLLEVDNDGKKVRRRTEIPEKKDVDDRTIYVESLPRHADHDWVINVFSRYGPVEYVSLPRYKRSRKIKEFGFVEFKSVSSVEKVLNTFKEFDGILDSESHDPSKLTSITSFIKEKDEEEEIEKCGSDDNTDNQIDKSDVELNSSEVESGKLKRQKQDEESNDEADDDVNSAKKPKIECEESAYCSGSDLEHQQVSKGDDEGEGADGEEEESHENTEKRKNRKHKKKKNHIKAIDESNFRELRILTKKDWKRLRNKYLNIQREKIKEFKQQIRNRSSLHGSNKTENYNNRSRNVNFYCANEDLQTSCPENNKCTTKSENKNNNSKNSASIVAESKKPLFEYKPGTIVHIKFLGPCVDVKSFKADMKQYNCVKYVDVKEGAFDSHVRCDDPTNAEQFVKQITCAEYQCEILTGDEDEKYWEKIMQDREMKLNERVKQKRGREKVTKKLASHIRFDDE